MTKLVKDLGPLAVAVAIFGALIAYLISTGNSLGNWLFAAFLVGHGFVHLMYLTPQPQREHSGAPVRDWPFKLERSAILSSVGASQDRTRLVGRLLVAVTVFTYLLAGLAAIPLAVPAAAWVALIVVGTLASAALLGLFFNAGLVIGLAVDAVLLAIVLISSWRPG